MEQLSKWTKQHDGWEKTEEGKRRIAIHEAGHAVAMAYHGNLECVTIDRATALRLKGVGEDNPILGMAKPSGECSSFYHMAMEMVAGPIMENALCPIEDKEFQRYCQRFDYEAVEEIAKEYAEKDSEWQPEQLQSMAEEMFESFRASENWDDAVLRVADALLARKTLTGDEVSEIVAGVPA